MDAIKRLATIVWKDSGASWLFTALTGLPPVLDFAKTQFPQTEPMLGGVQWWWGVVALATWVIIALSRRILIYEKPKLEVRPFTRAVARWRHAF